MATFRKSILFVCMVCLLVALAMFATGCQNENSDPTTTAAPVITNTDYTITVRTAGGILLEDVTVYVYQDETTSDLADLPKKLNSDGQYMFTAPTSDTYTVVLQDVPAGYDVQETYTVTGAQTEIILTSAPIQGEVPAGHVYKPGDIIHDYTFTDTKGVQHTISDILEEKNALVLNFWYINCSFCIKEFPSLQEAYEMYSDSVEVLALNIYDNDTEAINKLMKDKGLTFPAIQVEESLLSSMNHAGACPTTVIIDRYGMISFIISEDLSAEPAAFRALLRHFGQEEFTQGVVAGNANAIDKLIIEADIPYGCERYPYPVGAVEEYVGEVRANEPVYYTFYKGAGMTLRIEDPDVYVIFNDVTYYPENGVLELVLVSEGGYTGATIQLKTTGNVDKEVIIKQIPKQGSSEKPNAIKLGALTFVCNNQDAYYTFTAGQTGTFTITLEELPEGVTCSANMTNMRTFTVNAYSSADPESIDPETGKVTFTIAVEAGDTVRIILGVYGENATNIEIKALASILEVEGGGSSTENAYSVTVRDENNQPVPGVTVLVTVNGENIPAVTDENGVAKLDLKAGTYMLKLEVPEGYLADTQYLLTPANRELNITLITARYYTVRVSLTNGVLDAVVTVKIYDHANNGKLICSGTLDENGEYTFAYGDAEGFVAVLEGVPGSVYVQNSYELTGELTEIVLLNTSVDDTNASNQKYQLGDQICDFAVTTPDGRVFVVYELLMEKKAVVLAFWHTQNAPSVVAFQYLDAAYQNYFEKLEILAMTPQDKSDTDIADYQGKNDFSFPMAQCSSEWEKAFHLTVFPTLVIIDRNGTICLIHAGALTDAQALDTALAYYTADTYETTVVESIYDLVQQPGEPDGTQEYPYIVESNQTQVTVHLSAQGSAYYTIQETEPIQIRLEGEQAYIVYNGQTYTAQDGVVELLLNVDGETAPATIQIGNTGEETVTWTMTITVLAAG